MFDSVITNNNFYKLIYMKRFIFFILLTCIMSNAIGQTTITLSNKSTLDRMNEVVEIPWSLVMTKFPNVDTNQLVISVSNSNKPTPFQYELKGKSTVQNLLVQVSMKAGESISLKLKAGKRNIFESKTYCRFVPERKDDFAWENDKIAFRMYGKALELTPKENAYGTDVWSKRTNRLILNEWYKTNKYHSDNGDGLDYYHVGYFLGAGDIAPILKDSIWFPKNYTSWKVLDNGPLRSSFELKYDEWNVDGKLVSVTKSISLDANSQLNKVTVVYSYNAPTPLPLAIGISKRDEAGTMLLDEQNGILGYWEPTHGKDGTIGVGCIMPSLKNKMSLQKGHLLSVVSCLSNQPLVYYKGAAWDKAGAIKSSQDWFNYLHNFNLQLTTPVDIK